MEFYYYLIGIVGGVLLVLLITSLICFFKVFYSPKRKPISPDRFDIPPGGEYESHREQIVAWTRTVRAMPHEEISITSHDGLRLVGYYYEYRPGATTEIIFHGYRGNADRDLAGGVLRCHSLGRNALVVDQRASGKSEGRVISFGINERLDCIAWVNYAAERFGPDARIIITGVSMGAATVVMAAAEELPLCVKSVVADCGYTSAREIIRLIIAKMGLPVRILYPFVRLGAFIFGGFRLEYTSPIEAAGRAKLPIIFLHGDADTFVPCEMSARMYEVCPARKRLYFVKGAAHGLAYPDDISGYESELASFDKE